MNNYTERNSYESRMDHPKYNVSLIENRLALETNISLLTRMLFMHNDYLDAILNKILNDDESPLLEQSTKWLADCVLCLNLCERNFKSMIFAINNAIEMKNKEKSEDCITQDVA